MIKRTFEEVLAEQGQLIYTNLGDSMYPLIQPRDLLVIKPVTQPLKRYDIPLYQRDNGQYVLHRVMKIHNGVYVMCGDNRTRLEYGITDKQIIGILTGIIRNGETLPVQPPGRGLWYTSVLYRKIIFKLRKMKR